jgi:hypothetical protein
MEGECPHEPPGRAMEGECPHEPPGRAMEGECPHEPPGRAMEGECPHEPPSAVRKDGFIGDCGAPGGASVCLPADEQTLVPPAQRR